MGLETVTYIDDLVITNPTTTDKRREGDDHLRLIKKAIKASLPNVDGAVNPSVAEFNYLVGVTSAIQTQLDAMLQAATADGAGLTESGGVLAVGAGAGIEVNANDVAIEISGLTAKVGNALSASDGFLVDDNGTPKVMEYQTAGLRTQTRSTAQTMINSDVNTIQILTGSNTRAWALDTGVGQQGSFIILVQSGSGSIQITGTATTNSANGLFTRTTDSVAILLATADDVWVMFGDTSTS